MNLLPTADGRTGLKILQTMLKDRSLLGALTAMRQHVGPAFQITLPGFQPAVLVGPESSRQILVSQRQQFLWRSPDDPVVKLLRRGLLVEDGETHACPRHVMEPALQRQQVLAHIPAMTAVTDRVLANWADGSTQDMLVEMRKIALLIFMKTLLGVDFEPEMARLWQPILKAIKYISPGLWILWPEMPRLGFKQSLDELDTYLYQIISEQRANPPPSPNPQSSDLLTRLVQTPGKDDGWVRDQVLTMLIAGHDTSTAMLAWALFLLGQHREVMAAAQAEVAVALPSVESLPLFETLDQVIKETLRLYPPIHVGNRIAAENTAVSGYEIKAGTRVMYSIYLTHRDERHWPEPDKFMPERFARGAKRPSAFSYLPFGGGPRACIGAAFAQVEAKVVLARILQQFELTAVGGEVRPYMGATLEPHPGVLMHVRRRK